VDDPAEDLPPVHVSFSRPRLLLSGNYGKEGVCRCRANIQATDFDVGRSDALICSGNIHLGATISEVEWFPRQQ
jgi:hypothetical protein